MERPKFFSGTDPTPRGDVLREAPTDGVAARPASVRTYGPIKMGLLATGVAFGIATFNMNAAGASHAGSPPAIARCESAGADGGPLRLPSAGHWFDLLWDDTLSDLSADGVDVEAMLRAAEENVARWSQSPCSEDENGSRPADEC